jgi:hypothetical protein
VTWRKFGPLLALLVCVLFVTPCLAATAEDDYEDPDNPSTWSSIKSGISSIGAGIKNAFSPTYYSGYVGGSITNVSTKSGANVYHADGVVNFGGDKIKNGVSFETGYGDNLGTGNTLKYSFLERTEPAKDIGWRFKGHQALPFFDFYYYQNPYEGYLSTVSAGPGLGVYFIRTDKVNLRENVFAYLNQDRLGNTVDTVMTRGLLGFQAELEAILASSWSLVGNFTANVGTDISTDYNTDVRVALNWMIYKPISIQFRYDQKYHNLIPRGTTPYSNAFITQLLYSF